MRDEVSEIVLWDAVELSAAIHGRRVSCREVMSAFLGRIERVNPAVNAVVSLRDREALLGEADDRDAQLAHGESLGWMHGFPHAVKDLAATRGIRTTQGSPIFRDFVPAQDAIFVERLRAHGAIVIGKTNVPEFGFGSQTYNPVFGATGNAYDPSRTAGGSSGGAAAALALRMLPVADGSDMGGSLRNPAAFNNVFGFRPSQGRVPRGPAPEGFVQQLSVDGPMGRSVPDVAMLLSVMAGYDARAPLSLDQDPAVFTTPLDREVRGMRVAWLGNLAGYLPMESGILPLCQAACSVLEMLGCYVEEAVPRYPFSSLWETWVVLRHWLAAGSLGELYQDSSKRPLMKPEAQWEVGRGLDLRASDVYHASTARTEWYRLVLELFESYDFLVLPSAQVFPFDARVHWPATVDGVAMDTYHRWMEVAVPATLAGCPAISVPVGFDDRGRPMGMQIVGRPRGDLAVLQLAQAYDRATGWTRHRLPALLPTGNAV